MLKGHLNKIFVSLFLSSDFKTRSLKFLITSLRKKFKICINEIEKNSEFLH